MIHKVIGRIIDMRTTYSEIYYILKKAYAVRPAQNKTFDN